MAVGIPSYVINSTLQVLHASLLPPLCLWLHVLVLTCSGLFLWWFSFLECYSCLVIRTAGHWQAVFIPDGTEEERWDIACAV